MKHYLNDSTNVNDTFVGAGRCRRLAIDAQAHAMPGEAPHAIPSSGRITDTRGFISEWNRPLHVALNLPYPFAILRSPSESTYLFHITHHTHHA